MRMFYRYTSSGIAMCVLCPRHNLHCRGNAFCIAIHLRDVFFVRLFNAGKADSYGGILRAVWQLFVGRNFHWIRTIRIRTMYYLATVQRRGFFDFPDISKLQIYRKRIVTFDPGPTCSVFGSAHTSACYSDIFTGMHSWIFNLPESAMYLISLRRSI